MQTKYKFNLYNYKKERFEAIGEEVNYVFNEEEGFNSFGYNKFYKKDELEEHGYISSSNGNICIQVTLQVYEPMEIWIEPSSLSSDMEQLYETKVESDIVFETYEKRLEAHKAIIAIRAPYFYSLLQDESGTTYNEFPIEAKDSTLFEHVLKFIYTDTIHPNFMKEKPFELLEIANRFGIVRLKQMAEAELMKSIRIENTARMILVSDSYSCAALKENAFDFFASHASEIINTEGWYELKESDVSLREVVESILKSEIVDCVALMREKCNLKNISTDGTREVLYNRLN